MSQLGILGGTFDPPHLGHLILAQSALEYLKLDKIIFMPASRQPHKQQKEVTLVSSRLEMLKLAIGSNSRFEISDLELNREGLSFTCDTLRELKNIYHDDQP